MLSTILGLVNSTSGTSLLFPASGFDPHQQISLTESPGIEVEIFVLFARKSSWDPGANQLFYHAELCTSRGRFPLASQSKTSVRHSVVIFYAVHNKCSGSLFLEQNRIALLCPLVVGVGHVISSGQ